MWDGNRYPARHGRHSNSSQSNRLFSDIAMGAFTVTNLNRPGGGGQLLVRFVTCERALKRFCVSLTKLVTHTNSNLLAPLCDIPSGCCSFTGPWTVTRCSLRMLRRVATFCRPLCLVLLLVSFPRSRSPVVGVLGLC